MDCSICLDSFRTEDEVYRSCCNHFFHKGCLSEYHSNLLKTHAIELAGILAKNPYCPKDMRPQLRVNSFSTFHSSSILISRFSRLPIKHRTLALLYLQKAIELHILKFTYRDDRSPFKCIFYLVVLNFQRQLPKMCCNCS